MGTASKLRLRAGGTALFIKSPTPVREAIAVPEGAKITHCGKGPFEVVVAFVKRDKDVGALFEKAERGLAEDGTLWMAYPKEAAEIGWAPLTKAGWSPANRIVIDGTWHARRFEPSTGAQRKRKARGFGLIHKTRKKTVL